MWKYLIRPLLFLVSRRDPEVAHELALRSLGAVRSGSVAERVIRKKFVVSDPGLSQEVFGITFSNPVGLAAGFDKNAVALHGLAALGFGFVELGTVTRHPQAGNPRPRLFRFPKDGALINRMGFNNDGADAIAERLCGASKPNIPIGISLGKSKITVIEDAADDYAYSFRKLYPFGDYFAVNVSSPNTPGLRTLQEKEHLKRIIARLNEERLKLGGKKPILVKISPDLEWEALDEALDVLIRGGVEGIIATNTTLAREGLNAQTPESGGLSGSPLFKRSLEVVRYIHKAAPRIPIIGAGGVMSVEDACVMREAGANFIQVYTALVYNGPFFVRELNKGLLLHMERNSVDRVSGQQYP